MSYDIFPNKIEVNQAVIYVERLPDTVQNDHFDWGYHLTAFYGIDYRFTTAKGYIGSTIMLRPELRFDHSWDLSAYNNGKARNQLFFGMDLIYKF